jgi:hypothetical protein
VSSPKDDPERDPNWCQNHGKTREQEEREKKENDKK